MIKPTRDRTLASHMAIEPVTVRQFRTVKSALIFASWKYKQHANTNPAYNLAHGPITLCGSTILSGDHVAKANTAG